MKSVLITALVAGIVVAAALIIADNYERDSIDDVGDAAEDAYNTMNKHIRRVERSAGDLLDPALG